LVTTDAFPPPAAWWMSWNANAASSAAAPSPAIAPSSHVAGTSRLDVLLTISTSAR
jgi:hypothetical protein